MQPPFARVLLALLLAGAGVAHVSRAADVIVLQGTEPLAAQGDIPAQMRAGIDRFVTRETERSVDDRAKLWSRDFNSREAYEQSIAPNRERFRRMIGAIDPRLKDKPMLIAALIGNWLLD